MQPCFTYHFLGGAGQGENCKRNVWHTACVKDWPFSTVYRRKSSCSKLHKSKFPPSLTHSCILGPSSGHRGRMRPCQLVENSCRSLASYNKCLATLWDPTQYRTRWPWDLTLQWRTEKLGMNLAVLQRRKHQHICVGSVWKSHFICLLCLIWKLAYLHGLGFRLFTYVDDLVEYAQQQLDNLDFKSVIFYSSIFRSLSRERRDWDYTGSRYQQASHKLPIILTEEGKEDTQTPCQYVNSFWMALFLE